MIDDDLLLLASGRGALEQALDVSQLDSQHQLGDPELLSDLQRLGRCSDPHRQACCHGSLARCAGAITSRPDLEGMVAVLSPQSSDLALDAVVRFGQSVIPLAGKGSEADALLRSAGGDADALAVLADPAAVIAADSDGPMAQWIAPAIQRSLASADSGAAAAVIALDDGPLLWQQADAGWILGTRPNRPEPDRVDERLQELGLSASTLASDGEPLQVWTRLARQRRHGEETLQAHSRIHISEPTRQLIGSRMAS